MRIKIDKADSVFSRAIRTRDKWTCQRCGRVDVGGLQNSHYFGRARENTRFDPENCDTFCHGCHQYWGSTDREAYRDFKLKQLGEDGFNNLVMRANTYCKKDRKMALINAREYLKLIQEINDV